MTRRWKVTVGGELVHVCGFVQPQRAREHARKHYLERSERWEQISERPGPPEFRNQLAQAEKNSGRVSPEAYAVLDAAADRYEEAVCTHTAGARAQAYVHDPDNGAKPYPSLGVVSNAGIFVSFSRAAVSDLRTAFRPDVRTRRGPVTLRDYVDAAHNYLDRKLSQAELLGKT